MAQIPHANPGLICPLHKQDMAKVCHICPFWTHLRGTNPQNGEPMDDWQCAITWLPILLIENATRSNHVAAAAESLRNLIAAKTVVGFNGRLLEDN